MKVADYLVGNLIKMGITDVFGIPGGVVLEFVYALNRKKENIHTHLLHQMLVLQLLDMHSLLKRWE